MEISGNKECHQWTRNYETFLNQETHAGLGCKRKPLSKKCSEKLAAKGTSSAAPCITKQANRRYASRKILWGSPSSPSCPSLSPDTVPFKYVKFKLNMLSVPMLSYLRLVSTKRSRQPPGPGDSSLQLAAYPSLLPLEAGHR